MKTAIACIVMTAAATVSASAADLTGRWSGTAQVSLPNGEHNEVPLFMTVKQTGSEVKGTIGPGETEDQQWPMMKAKVEGDTLTFEVQSNGPLFTVKLTLADGRLKGDAVGDGHEGPSSAKVDLGRRAQ